MSLKSFTLPILLGGLIALPAFAAKAATQPVEAVAKVDAPAPDFTLVDAEGNEHSLSAYRGKYVVLEWVNFDCPFVKKHYGAGNMQGLQTTYREKGSVWLSINSSAPGKQGHFTGDALKARMEKEKAVPSAYLLDPDGAVGKVYQAKTTPHMFVISPEGILLYDGAIDDKPSARVKDVEGAKNFVKATLDQAMLGKTVEVKTTVPYGCSVKYKN